MCFLYVLVYIPCVAGTRKGKAGHRHIGGVCFSEKNVKNVNDCFTSFTGIRVVLIVSFGFYESLLYVLYWYYCDCEFWLL